MTTVLYERIYEKDNKNVNLTEFVPDTSGSFYFHFFCRRHDSEREPLAVHVNLYCDNEQFPVLTIEEPSPAWSFYHTTITTTSLRDFSVLDIRITQERLGSSSLSYSENDVRQVVLQHVPDPALRTFQSFLHDWNFSQNSISSIYVANIFEGVTFGTTVTGLPYAVQDGYYSSSDDTNMNNLVSSQINNQNSYFYVSQSNNNYYYYDVIFEIPFSFVLNRFFFKYFDDTNLISQRPRTVSFYGLETDGATYTPIFEKTDINKSIDTEYFVTNNDRSYSKFKFTFQSRYRNDVIRIQQIELGGFISLSNEWGGNDAIANSTDVTTLVDLGTFTIDPSEVVPESSKDISLSIPVTTPNSVKLNRITFNTTFPYPESIYIFAIENNTKNAIYGFDPTNNFNVDSALTSDIVDISFTDKGDIQNFANNFEIYLTQNSHTLTVSGFQLFGYEDGGDANNITNVVYDGSTEFYQYKHPFLETELSFPNDTTLRNLLIQTDVSAESLLIQGKKSENTTFVDIITVSGATVDTSNIIVDLANNDATYNDYRFVFQKENREIAVNVIDLSGLRDDEYEYSWIRDSIRNDNYVTLNTEDSFIQQIVPLTTTYSVNDIPHPDASYSYENVGQYNFDISATLNTQTIRLVQDHFDVDKAVQTDDWDPMEILINDNYTYQPDNKTIALSVSGGFPDGDVSFGCTPGSVQDASFTYVDVGEYIISATRDGSLNYQNYTVSKTITIGKASQPAFDFSMAVYDFSYNPNDTFVDLTVSGGATDRDEGAVVFTVSSSESAFIDANRLYYTNVGTYDVTATKDGSANYYDISAIQTITIGKTDQLIYYTPLQITNVTSVSYDYFNPSFPITVSGGWSEGNVEYSTTALSATLNNAIFNYSNADVGTYTIAATRKGDPNYFDISTSADITIERGPQPYFYFLNHDEYLYNPDPLKQTIQLKAVGGAGDGAISYGGANVTPDGVLSYYDSVGDYVVSATKAASTNYTETSISMTLRIIPRQPDPLIITTSYVYIPSQIVFLVGDFVDVSLTQVSPDITLTHYANTHTYQLTYPSAGTYTIHAFKEKDNYDDISENVDITITKAFQSLALDLSYVYYYPPINRSYFYTTELLQSLSGGDITYAVSNAEVADVCGNLLYVYQPDVSFVLYAAQTGTNYVDVSQSLSIDIWKPTIQQLHDFSNNTVYANPLWIKPDAYYTNDEIDAPKIYTLLELIQGGFTLVELKELGYSACEVYSSGVYTVRDLERAGYRLKFCIR